MLSLQGAGAGLEAAGAYGQASSQRSALKYDARIADMNALLAEQRAQVALEQGRFQVNQVRREGAQIKGSQRAQMAASGVDLTYGTPAAVISSTEMLTELDVQQAEINAVREAWGYRTQATGYQNEARSARATAKGINPLLAAGTSLLGSATSVASSYYGMKKAGAFDKVPTRAARRSASFSGGATGRRY